MQSQFQKDQLGNIGGNRSEIEVAVVIEEKNDDDLNKDTKSGKEMERNGKETMLFRIIE